MSVSACLITWNEEQFLPQCLNFLNSIPEIEQICVLDSESTDNTQNILKNWKGKKELIWGSQKFENFSKQRNDCMSQANKDWILMIDGDELYSPQISYLLKKLNILPKINAVRTWRAMMWPDEKHRLDIPNIDPQIRIWRRGFVHHERVIHELPMAKDGRCLHGDTSDDILTTYHSTDKEIIKVFIKHFQMLKTNESLEEKGKRWKEMGMIDLSTQYGLPIGPEIWLEQKIKAMNSKCSLVKLDTDLL